MPYSVGAVISHVSPDGLECTIADASRTLTLAEKTYSQLKKEALYLIFGVNKFYHYLHGQPVTLYTDHTPLTCTTIFGEKEGIPTQAAASVADLGEGVGGGARAAIAPPFASPPFCFLLVV